MQKRINDLIFFFIFSFFVKQTNRKRLYCLYNNYIHISCMLFQLFLAFFIDNFCQEKLLLKIEYFILIFFSFDILI